MAQRNAGGASRRTTVAPPNAVIAIGDDITSGQHHAPIVSIGRVKLISQVASASESALASPTISPASFSSLPASSPSRLPIKVLLALAVTHDEASQRPKASRH